MTIRWKPNATVAAIIERDGKFLLVEETTPDGLRLNNPAGHLDEGESLIAPVSAKRWKRRCTPLYRSRWLACTCIVSSSRRGTTSRSPV
jgi:8-oxo-dGTP pyrophosphatase MutT (NUDIX family)